MYTDQHFRPQETHRHDSHLSPREQQLMTAGAGGGQAEAYVEDEPPSAEQISYRSMPVEARERIDHELAQFDAERQRLASQMEEGAGPTSTGARGGAAADAAAPGSESGAQQELVPLGRQMCDLMGQMAEFTRGRGPLRTSLDVIHAAHHISTLRRRFDAIARRIADSCPDARSRNEVAAYLSQIDFYCHQMNITSKVKAGNDFLSPELIGNHLSLSHLMRYHQVF